MANNPLTYQEQENIKECFNRTKSVWAVTKELGHAHQTIKKYIDNTKFKIKDERVVEIYEICGSLERTGKILGLSSTSVWRRLQKLNVVVGQGSKSWKRLYLTLRRRVSKSNWRKEVLVKFNNQCDCGKISNIVHHIKKLSDLRDEVIKNYPHINPFESYQKLRQFTDLVMSLHSIDDGIVLCKDCHEKEHSVDNGKFKRSLNIKK